MWLLIFVKRAAPSRDATRDAPLLESTGDYCSTPIEEIYPVLQRQIKKTREMSDDEKEDVDDDQDETRKRPVRRHVMPILADPSEKNLVDTNKLELIESAEKINEKRRETARATVEAG
jgi:hypothetical protein